MRKDTVSIGRGGSSAWVDVQISGSSKVSREHLRLRVDPGGRFFIQDVSLWGTSVDGEADTARRQERGRRGAARTRTAAAGESADRPGRRRRHRLRGDDQAMNVALLAGRPVPRSRCRQPSHGSSASRGSSIVSETHCGHAGASGSVPHRSGTRARPTTRTCPSSTRNAASIGVIDGVGGQAAGEFAAAIAYDVILQRLARPLGTPAERVREAIAIANNEIFRRAGDVPRAGRHDVRRHARHRQRRAPDDRARRRQPSLQARAPTACRS